MSRISLVHRRTHAPFARVYISPSQEKFLHETLYKDSSCKADPTKGAVHSNYEASTIDNLCSW